ncbi:MAG TPA: hypothetical protein VFA12_20160 [Stellaceae bacterium]|nr:hypothetical protein [Stellaceae bacterium]
MAATNPAAGVRRRKPRARLYRRIDLRRRRRRVHPPTITAEAALHLLMEEADIFAVGRSRYLVAWIDADVLETLIVAAGATEDREENGDDEPDSDREPDVDDEPSVGADDLESDGLDDEGGERTDEDVLPSPRPRPPILDGGLVEVSYDPVNGQKVFTVVRALRVDLASPEPPLVAPTGAR